MAFVFSKAEWKIGVKSTCVVPGFDVFCKQSMDG